MSVKKISELDEIIDEETANSNNVIMEIAVLKNAGYKTGEVKTSNLLLFCAEAGFAFLMGDAGDTTWTGIAAFETRFFAVSHCRSLRGHTFCVNRKYAKSHKRGGDCDFPAPFETPPLNRQRGTVRGSPLNPSKRGQSFGYQASFLCQVYFFKKVCRQC